VERENAQYQHPEPFLAGLHLPALGDEILGKGAGDEFTVTTTLPDTWPEKSQAGQEMAVQVEVLEVKRHVLPELDDEFAERLDYDDLEELTEEVREDAERQAERDAEEETDRRTVDALIAAAPFDIPEDVVKEETARRVERVRAMQRMKGASEEEIEEKVAEAKASEREVVERDFRATFLLDAIAKKEKIFVTENEVKERVAQMAAAYHRSVEEMEEYLEQRDMLGGIRSQMREEKVHEILRKRVKLEEPS
jgi:trigger factor